MRITYVGKWVHTFSESDFTFLFSPAQPGLLRVPPNGLWATSSSPCPHRAELLLRCACACVCMCVCVCAC